MTFEMKTAKQILKERGLEQMGEVQKYIDINVIRLSDKFVPWRDGYARESAELYTKIGSGQVEYKTPYIRKIYYVPMNFFEAPQRGNKWFERMKVKYKDQILKGAQGVIDRG